MRCLIVILMLFFPLACFSAQPKQYNDYTKQNHVKKILLVVAMDSEASPLVKALQLKKVTHSFSGLPMQGYTGRYHNLDIFLICNGLDPLYKVENVGTQPATLATYVGIEYFHPDLVISIGTAGGIAENKAHVGDIYISKKVDFYARRIPVPVYAEYGIGGYPSADFTTIANQLHFRSGIVCSGDSFDENPTDKDAILKNGCSVREMEAAGVAWVSMLMKTPMIAIKGITDLVGSETGHDDYNTNLPKVTKNLAEKITQFFNRLN